MTLWRAGVVVVVALGTGCLIDNPLYLGSVPIDTDTGGADAAGGSLGGSGSTAAGAGAGAGSGAGPDTTSGLGSTTDSPGTSLTTSISTGGASSSGGSTTGASTDPFCDASDLDLIACYEFESDVPSGSFADGSGYGHDGTASNASVDAGVRGLALSTDASSEVRISNTAELQLVSALTIELWIFPRDAVTGAFQHIVDKDRHYTTGIATDGHLRCRIPDGLIEAPFPVAESEWTHLACVFDGDTLTMYLDGIVAAQSSMQPQVPSSNDDLTLGSAPDGDWPYDGLIDDLRIWSRPLSQQEICDSYGAC